MNYETKITIVIPNLNGQQYCKKLLESLAKQTFKDFEILLFDNGSTDFSIQVYEEQAQKHSIPLRIMRSPTNIGFVKAANQAIFSTTSDYVLVINNDMWFECSWLDEMFKTISPRQKMSFVSCTVLGEDGKLQCKGGSLMDKYGFSSKRNNDSDILPIFSIAGSPFLIRTSTLKRIGAYDEKYFMYYEELDLSWRLRLLGYEMVYASSAVCYHLGRVTTSKMVGMIGINYYSIRNQLRTLLKNYSCKSLFFRLPIFFFLMNSLGVILSMMSRNAGYFANVWKAYWWNLSNWRSTMTARRSVRSNRIISDSILENSMLKNFVFRLPVTRSAKEKFR